MFTQDELFYHSAGVTALNSIGSVPLRIIFAFGVALMLNQVLRGQRLFRTIFYLPTIVPAFASSILWLWPFNPDFGLLNAILRTFGLGKLQRVYDSRTVIPSMILMRDPEGAGRSRNP